MGSVRMVAASTSDHGDLYSVVTNDQAAQLQHTADIALTVQHKLHTGQLRVQRTEEGAFAKTRRQRNQWQVSSFSDLLPSAPHMVSWQRAVSLAPFERRSVGPRRLNARDKSLSPNVEKGESGSEASEAVDLI